jgi:hypothetical protein
MMPSVTSITTYPVTRGTAALPHRANDVGVGRDRIHGIREVSGMEDKKITPKPAEDSKKDEPAATRVTKKRSLRRRARKVLKKG